MRPVNLFLTEDGVVKLGYYGLTTQSEYYSIKTDCDGVRNFAPEVFKGEYEMKSDVWLLGIGLIEMMGIAPFLRYGNYHFPVLDQDSLLPLKKYSDVSAELVDFLKMGLKKERWSVNELLNVSVMGWRMMSSIHL